MKADSLMALAQAWARTADPDDRERLGSYIAERFGDADVETWRGFAAWMQNPARVFLAHLAHEHLAVDEDRSPDEAMEATE